MSINQNLSLFAKTLNANGHIDSSEAVVVANNFFFANGDPVSIEGALLKADPVFTGTMQGANIDVTGNIESSNSTIKGTTADITMRNLSDAAIGVVGHDGTDLVVEAQTDVVFTDIGGTGMSGDVYIKKATTEHLVWHAGNDGDSSGLDADLLDGFEGAYYLDAGNLTGTVDSGALSGTYAINITGTADRLGGELPATYASNTYMQGYVAGEIATKLDSSSYTAADVFDKVLTLDGAGTGLDADLLDGLQATSFMRTNADTSFTGAITGSGSINIGGTITGPTTDTLLVKNSAGSTLKTIRGV